MSYINTNKTLNLLEEVLTQNFSAKLEYLPEQFHKEQLYAIELFKKRLFLEQIIDKTISFNRSIEFDESSNNLFLTTSAEMLVDVFKLRSDVYSAIPGYQDEFPDVIEGLNFDKFDKHSAIVYYKKGSKITATTRLIFDIGNLLPSEEKYSFDKFRKQYKIGEVSRLMIHNDRQCSGQEFKYLTLGIYKIYLNSDVEILMSGIKQEHYKLYSKFGGFKIEKELNNYGNLDLNALILSWDPSKISNFFKKVFLNN